MAGIGLAEPLLVPFAVFRFFTFAFAQQHVEGATAAVATLWIAMTAGSCGSQALT